MLDLLLLLLCPNLVCHFSLEMTAQGLVVLGLLVHSLCDTQTLKICWTLSANVSPQLILLMELPPESRVLHRCYWFILRTPDGIKNSFKLIRCTAVCVCAYKAFRALLEVFADRFLLFTLLHKVITWLVSQLGCVCLFISKVEGLLNVIWIIKQGWELTLWFTKSTYSPFHFQSYFPSKSTCVLFCLFSPVLVSLC